MRREEDVMERQELIALLMAAQGYMEGAIAKLSEEQIATVPEGMSNNIQWNLGHLAQSLAGVTYPHAGLEAPLPANYTDLFKGGTSPSTWDNPPPVAEVVENFKKIMPQVLADLNAGKFDGFKAFELMPGLNLGSIDQALGFHLMHSGMHMNAIGALKKALG
jgi:hypothetical protein